MPIDETTQIAAAPREPDRISRMAAVSLLCAIFFCLPGMGLMAAILGVVSLYRIGGSGGRLGGRTFAAIGLTIGLISTTGWLAVGLGARQAYATYAQGMAVSVVKYLGAIEAADYTAASEIFDAKTRPSPAQFDTLRVALSETLGKPTGPVNTLADAKVMWSMRQSAIALDPGRTYTGGPLKFEKGIAMVLFRLAPGTPATAYFPATGVDQITVALPSGEVLRIPDTVEAPR